jgi:hypothetical protein
MLQSLQVTKQKDGMIELGFDADNEGKADGNIRGTYGTDKADASKARNFLGLTQNDFNKILKKFT